MSTYKLIPAFVIAMTVVVTGTVSAQDCGWRVHADEVNDSILALGVYNGELIAGGYFTAAGGVACNSIARWNGNVWQSLGSGMDGNPFYVPWIHALTVYDGELIAGGNFEHAGGVYCANIARWNGSTWAGLDFGFDRECSWYSPSVRALAVHEGELIAGGGFEICVTGEDSVAAWNGVSWRPLGAGIAQHSHSDPPVRALAVYNGELIAAGTFLSAGDPCCGRIARWNGVEWLPVGTGTDDMIAALAVYNDELIAGGVFATAGGVPCNGVARWDGAEWHALGSGTDGSVSALTVYNDELIAGGTFTTAGGVPCNGIARWDGRTWQPLGSGIGGGSSAHVAALAPYRADLIVGGDFMTAGGAPSHFWARWSCTCPADFNDDGTANSQDFFDFLTAFFTEGAGADFNGDNVINSQDFFDFLSEFFAGCD